MEYILVSDIRDKYIADARKFEICGASAPHATITQSLKPLFAGTQWTLEQLSFIAGRKSVNKLISKFGLSEVDGLRIVKGLGGTSLHELENLFRSYWAHRGPATRAQGSSRVNTQDIWRP